MRLLESCSLSERAVGCVDTQWVELGRLRGGADVHHRYKFQTWLENNLRAKSRGPVLLALGPIVRMALTVLELVRNRCKTVAPLPGALLHHLRFFDDKLPLFILLALLKGLLVFPPEH